MSNKKLTKSDLFAIIKANYSEDMPNYAEVINFCEKSIEQLAVKSGKTSKEVEANNALRDEIYACMEPNRLYTITEMLTSFPCCAGMQNQRVTALVRGMIPNRVERIEEKGRAYFLKI